LAKALAAESRENAKKAKPGLFQEAAFASLASFAVQVFAFGVAVYSAIRNLQLACSEPITRT